MWRGRVITNLRHISTGIRVSNIHSTDTPIAAPIETGSILIILLLILVGFLSTRVSADDESTNEIASIVFPGYEQLVSDRPGDQLNPAIAFYDDILVVWQDTPAGSDVDIYGQRFNGYGKAIEDAFPIREQYNDDINPAVAYNPIMQEYLVVWEREYTETDHEIYGQRVGTDGSLVDNVFCIAGSYDNESNPEIAYNPGIGGYTVSWEDTSAGNTNIFAQLLNGYGDPYTNTIAIASDSIQEERPTVAYLENPYWSGSLIIWQETHATRGDYQIYGIRMENDNSLPDGKFAISTWEHDQLVPDIACGEQCLVVYEDHHWGSGTYWYIHGAMLDIDSGGNLLVQNPNFGISYGPEHRQNPTVTWDPVSNDKYLVGWNFETSEGDQDIYAQAVLTDGSLFEEEFAAAAYTGEQVSPALPAISDGNTFLVWSDDRDEDSQYDLFIREIHISCSEHCDCPADYFCYHGQCLLDPKMPVYCCDRALCPPGRWCIDSNGKKDVCYEDPSYYCESACDCGPAHCCKENRCIKDLNDPWLSKMNGDWTGPPACVIGTDPTYCCHEPTCYAAFTYYTQEGDGSAFRCDDQGTTEEYCSGDACFGTTCNCLPGESCVEFVTYTPGEPTPGQTCFLLQGGMCISNAIAEAVFDYGSGDLISCGNFDSLAGTKFELGWSSSGTFAYERIIGVGGSCGNDSCDGGEFPDNCPEDCTCGDGSCAPSEQFTCSADCGECGDETCQDWESHWGCPSDCVAGLADHECQLDEFWSAPENCGCPDAPYYPGIYAVCGDQYYAGPSNHNPETDLSCPGECSSLSEDTAQKTTDESDQIIWSRRLGGELGARLPYYAPDRATSLDWHDGNIFFTGATYTRDFPVTIMFTTSTSTLYNFDWDAFATMLDSDGNLMESKFLGVESGFDHEKDIGRDIRVDQEGQIFLTGSMELVRLSPDFNELITQTTGLMNPAGGYAIAINDDGSIILAGDASSGGIKLNPDWSLAYTVTLGGDTYDLEVDSAGNAYFSGSMGVVKLNPSGSPGWTTSLNGTGYGLALLEDKVYVTGITHSDSFPVTAGAVDTIDDPAGDAFLAVLNASDGAILFGTYLGGTGYDIARDVAVDPWGNAYLVGETHSNVFPVTAEAFDSSLGGFGDAFIAVIRPGEPGVAELLYASYIGGDDPMVPPYNTPDGGFGIDLDELGYVYIIGETGSADFPTTDADPILGFTDIFVMKIDLRDYLNLKIVYLPLIIR